jgi:hypothetical protein
MAAIYRLSHIEMFEFIVENRRNFVSLQGDSIETDSHNVAEIS